MIIGVIRFKLNEEANSELINFELQGPCKVTAKNLADNLSEFTDNISTDQQPKTIQSRRRKERTEDPLRERLKLADSPGLRKHIFDLDLEMQMVQL